MNDFVKNLKRQAEENPLLALAVGIGLLTAGTKLLGAGVDAKNAQAWSREVARRSMKDAAK